jgi:S-adenosylmethionine decarboxylase
MKLLPGAYCDPTLNSRSGIGVEQARATHFSTLAGLHLMGDFYDCVGDKGLMISASCLRNRCLELARNVGLTPMGDYFHPFDGGGGVTGVVVLSESHMSVHTWPEHRYVTVDVYVCNYGADNRDKARRLFGWLLEMFGPQAPRTFALDRA